MAGRILEGNLPRLRLGARARLPADQHRPDRRHGRRDLGQLARLASEKTIELAPDSVTIYQMELPFNTTISKELKGSGSRADRWPTGRRSAMGGIRVRGDRAGGLSRRQRLHRGQGIRANEVRLPRPPLARRRHVRHGRRLVRPRQRRALQNVDTWETYSESVLRNEIPLRRAYRPTPDERFIREMVLQLKLGSVRPQYFRDKYGVDILQRFAAELDGLAERRLLERSQRTARGADAERPPLRRRPAAPLLPAAAHRHPLHVMHDAPTAPTKNVATETPGHKRRTLV